jgi:hypothetical protein
MRTVRDRKAGICSSLIILGILSVFFYVNVAAGRIRNDIASGIKSAVVAAPVHLASSAKTETFNSGVQIPIVVNAFDADGTITKVVFYADGAALDTETVDIPLGSHNYQYTWNDAPVGDHTLTAEATDNDGATGVSAAVHIRVNADAVSVTLTPDAWPIGAIKTGEIKESGSFSAVNSGDAAEDFKVRATDGTNGWAIGAFPGPDVFAAEVDRGADGSYDMILTAENQVLAEAVGAGANQSFGLKYFAPFSDTQGGGRDHTFSIVITASKTP